MTNTSLDGYLSPRELLPDRDYRAAGLEYSRELNASRILLDQNLSSGRADKTAILYKDEQVSYRELYKRSLSLGCALKDLGIQRGDRVLLRLYNRPEFIVSWLALLRIGAVSVATMPMLKVRELANIAQDCEAKALIVSAELWDECTKAKGDTPELDHVIGIGSIEGALCFDELLNHSGASDPIANTAHDDVATILYTSGSTGRPKGTVHFHEDIAAIADTFSARVLKPSPDDVFGGHPTLAFAYGLGGLLVFPLSCGATTSLLDAFNSTSMLEVIARDQVTILFCAATAYKKLLIEFEMNPDARKLIASLRTCVSAGETLPASVFADWKKTTGIEILDGIGSTEMLHIFISSRPGQAQPGCTGLVVPGYQAKIVDDDMCELARGQPGHLAVKGPTGCRYWKNQEQQKQYVHQGWNLPGDIFHQDEKGFFYYHCRSDDLITCGGYKISGPEVESVLLEHTSVSEAAVVASPDPVRGSVPKAYIVLRDGYPRSVELAKQLQDLVKSQLAAYKYPRMIEFVESLPRTETGKLRRFAVRDHEQQATPVR